MNELTAWFRPGVHGHLLRASVEDLHKASLSPTCVGRTLEGVLVRVTEGLPSSRMYRIWGVRFARLNPQPSPFFGRQA